MENTSNDQIQLTKRQITEKIKSFSRPFFETLEEIFESGDSKLILDTTQKMLNWSAFLDKEDIKENTISLTKEQMEGIASGIGKVIRQK